MSEHRLTPARLQPLREVARHREQDAAQKLAEIRRVLLERESQLRMLEAYEEPAQQHSCTVADLGNREAFRARLAEAVRYQRQLIEETQRRVEYARRHWIEQQRELDVVDKLIERSQKQQRALMDRREQRQFDELSQRLCGTSFAMGEA